MSLALEQNLRQNLSMQLTPSQRLSLEILQLGIQNLELRIEEELESNPLLEVSGESNGEKVDSKSLENEESTSSSENGSEIDTMDRDNRNEMSEYLEPYFNEESGRARKADEDEDDYINNIAAKGDQLMTFLEEQIEYINPSHELKPYVLYLINQLDERGYIPHPIEDLFPEKDKELEDMGLLKKALLFIQQKLDPAGLGGLDLKECLLLQIKRLGPEFELEYHIFKDHFEDLLHNRLNVIAQRQKLAVPRVLEIVDFFKSLEFRPAAPYASSSISTIRPDATVKYDSPDEMFPKGRFSIQLSRRGIPELIVTPGKNYKSIAMSKKEKKYILEKSQSAKAMLEAIRRRNETLLLIIQAISQNQIAFFENGPGSMKPLLMQKIAKDVEMSAATITRTVKDKYIQTDFGIFPLKYFFGVKIIRTSDGSENSRDDVLRAVHSIVEAEDKKKPLSDSSISKVLVGKGYHIATRTVSKYRDILDLPSSGKRKKF